MYIPLVLVARESEWTQAQADLILGDLVLALKVKWAMFGSLLGLGVICIGLTVMYVMRRRKLKRSLLTTIDRDSLVEIDFARI